VRHTAAEGQGRLAGKDLYTGRSHVAFTAFHDYAPMPFLEADQYAGRYPQGMRTVGQMRRDASMPVPVKPDSEYKPIERQKRVFNPLSIPKKLQAELPFASKPKVSRPLGRTQGWLGWSAPSLGGSAS
jgi:hypothetical protein